MEIWPEINKIKNPFHLLRLTRLLGIPSLSNWEQISWSPSWSILVSQETANSVPSVLAILVLKKLLGFVYTNTKIIKMWWNSCLFHNMSTPKRQFKFSICTAPCKTVFFLSMLKISLWWCPNQEELLTESILIIKAMWVVFIGETQVKQKLNLNERS